MPACMTRIVESPGLSLSRGRSGRAGGGSAQRRRQDAAGRRLTYGIFSGERERLARAIVTLISEQADRPPDRLQRAVGDVSRTRRRSRSEVTHLGLVMVDPDVQGQGLSWVLYGLTTLVLFARDGLRPKWISNVTQVPAVFGMVCETFSDVFPSPRGRRAAELCPSATRPRHHARLSRGVRRRR